MLTGHHGWTISAMILTRTPNGKIIHCRPADKESRSPSLLIAYFFRRVKEQRDNCECQEHATTGKYYCRDRNFRSDPNENNTLTWYLRAQYACMSVSKSVPNLTALLYTGVLRNNFCWITCRSLTRPSCRLQYPWRGCPCLMTTLPSH